MDFAVNGLYIRDKASVQRAPLRSAECADNAGCPVDPLYDGEFRHLHRRSSPNSGQTQTTAFAGRRILRVGTLSLRSVI